LKHIGIISPSGKKIKYLVESPCNEIFLCFVIYACCIFLDKSSGFSNKKGVFQLGFDNFCMGNFIYQWPIFLFFE